MSLDFTKWSITQRTGEREAVAKVAVSHIVGRDDLVRSCERAIVDHLPHEFGQDGIDRIAHDLARTDVEKVLRSLLTSYGSVYFESGDHDLSCGDLDDAVREAAQHIISRLYPELTQKG